MHDAPSIAAAQREAGARSLEMTRRFRAPRPLVWRAFADAAHFARWWGPRGAHVTDCAIDFTIGGGWHANMRLSTGTEHHVSGRYVAIEPQHLLVFTWAWRAPGGERGHETTVELRFRALDDETELSLRQTLFETAESCRLHREGWGSGLDSLDDYLASDEGAQ